MPSEVDKSLLDRLQALRGGPAGSHQPSRAPQEIKIDTIERVKTPSREDALAARLKSLREGSPTPEPESRPRASPAPPQQSAAAAEKHPTGIGLIGKNQHKERDMEHIFETDDDTLQELLADVTPDETFGASATYEPSDEQVRALLEQLADDIPKDDDAPSKGHGDEDEPDSDDSDGEVMARKIKDVMDRHQDEAELESREGKEDKPDDFQDPHDEAAHDSSSPADLGLPSVPLDLQDLPSSPGASKQGHPDMDDIAARMAALRAPSRNTDGGGDDDDDGSFALPSVPTSRPSGKPVKRLETTTKYTDDDVESWCTVCLEDATLRCLGCDDDVYCTRCWREMHVGPAAAFDDRSHRAVQFTRDKKKKEAPRKVALGA